MDHTRGLSKAGSWPAKGLSSGLDRLRALAIGFFHQPTRSPLSDLGAWDWNIEFHQRPGRAFPHWGTADTLEDAMAALKACWESADVPIKWPPA